MKNELSLMDFNIAIKPLINGLFAKTTIDDIFYQELLTDIYMNHYAAWYKKYMDSEQVKLFFDTLLDRIRKEFPNKIEIDDITLVNCILFQNGLCQQISTENITTRKKRVNYIKHWAISLCCVIFSIITAIFCYMECFSSAVTFFCAVLTILSSIISLEQFIKERLSSK